MTDQAATPGWMDRACMMLELIRFSHSVFALPFALMAAVLAWTTVSTDNWAVDFRWRDLAGIIVCMVASRSAAMAFNRIVDSRWDAANPRTAGRHLPAGKLAVRGVVLFTLLSVAGFLAGTLLFLPNRLPAMLAPFVLIVLLAYSYTKRFTALSHYWLGMALMLAPIAVWIALRGEVLVDHPADLLPATVLGLAVLFWVGGFDIIYACQDHEFDRRCGLHSIPAKFGVRRALWISAMSHGAMIVFLALVPWSFGIAGLTHSLGWVYHASVAAVAVLIVVEHALVRPDDLTRVNAAFFNVNAVISFGLFAATALDTWLVTP